MNPFRNHCCLFCVLILCQPSTAAYFSDVVCIINSYRVACFPEETLLHCLACFLYQPMGHTICKDFDRCHGIYQRKSCNQGFRCLIKMKNVSGNSAYKLLC